MAPENDPLYSGELLSITEVERQTGIRQATLRMWERRYGFPQPLRDQHGDRVYPLNQVERLHAARRLLDQGIRPGKIFSNAPAPDMTRMAATGQRSFPMAGNAQPILGLLREYRLAQLHSDFEYRVLELGLRRFVIEFLAPLSTQVGLAWGHGELPVRCEHLYAQAAVSFLHAKQAALRVVGGARPKVVLATSTGEAHALGILMVEAILVSLGVDCVQLGSEVPPSEVVAAARDTRADIVALSFSSYFPRKDVVRTVRSLRAALPPATVLWIGGDGVPGATAFGPGVHVFVTLAAIEPALLFWRSRLSSPERETQQHS